MKSFAIFAPLSILLLLSFCNKVYTANFDTPQGAILMLENAYKTKNVEGAVAAKAFEIEAADMLAATVKFKADQALIKETADVLELSFRKQIQQTGFPDFNGISCSFPNSAAPEPDRAIVTEVCTYPDGGTSTQKLKTAKTKSGWRVVGLVE